jgi:uncharacterized protein (TIGR02453 family)
MFTQATLNFLSDLSQNNNREWFTANRPRYDAAKRELENVVGLLLNRVGEFESLPNTQPKDCIFRINRDVRFSKNKDPYKSNLSAAIGPGGRHSGRIDFYFHIQPNGQSLLGAGMWNPTPKQLAAFRQELDFNPARLTDIIQDKNFRAYFPEIWGESLKKIPKGFSEENPNADLLKRKQLFFMHKFTDEAVTSPDFIENILTGCRLIKPYCDFLNTIFFDEVEETFEL